VTRSSRVSDGHITRKKENTFHWWSCARAYGVGALPLTLPLLIAVRKEIEGNHLTKAALPTEAFYPPSPRHTRQIRRGVLALESSDNIRKCRLWRLPV
jgi:hypothetical protein